MNDVHFQPPPLTDPLGEVLHMLRLTGTLYCRAEMTAPWGIEMPRLPGAMLFMIVTSGRGWLRMADAPPQMLEQGSMVLLPHGTRVDLGSSPSTPTVPLFDIPVTKVSERYEFMQWGGGGALMRATTGVVQFDHIAAQRLISLLPPVIRVDAWDEDVDSWMQSTLRLIAREAASLRPGGETVMTRLADIMVIQAMRRWLDTAPEANLGWLAALRDPQIGRALAQIHRGAADTLSVAGLAGAAGMSRSAFSARFSDMVGQPVMQYVTQWRLHLARMALQDSGQPVGVIGLQAGYRSEAAFGRAFKQFFGVSPGAVRRNAVAA